MTLVCNITGVDLKYNWTFKGEEVKENDISLTPGKLDISGVSFSDAGMYTCIGTNKAGSATQYHNLTVFGKL